MERFLLGGEEQALLATARAVATALHDRPGLMRARPSRDNDFRREAEEELRRLAAQRGEAEPKPDEGGEPLPPVLIDREEAAARRGNGGPGPSPIGVRRATPTAHLDSPSPR